MAVSPLREAAKETRMMKTRTGGFRIGFRDATPWKQETGALAAWAKAEGFAFLDLAAEGERKLPKLKEAGLEAGAVDLPEWTGMIAADRRARKDAVARNAEFVKRCAGAHTFLTVMRPADPALERKQNFAFMVESYGELADALESAGARVVIEGWPAPGCVCCTPEGYRSFLAECSSDRVGINYDPSHLIRMGIDPLRFLREFADKVYHVHAKDTEIIAENLYEYGHELPGIFTPNIRNGALSWRYTIPGHGQMRWTEAFRILEESAYTGGVSIELEDARFCDGKAENAQAGLRLAGSYLTGC
jgi:sugar phosphate isomerase/epimerase